MTKKIKKLGIVIKYNCPIALNTAKEVVEYLKKKKVGSVVEKKFAKKLHVKDVLNFKNPQVSIALSIGGDGTMLRTSAFLHGKPVALLGIKRGARGFLSETSNYKYAIDRLLAGKFFVEERSKLQVRINGKKACSVLNDIIILSSRPGKIQRFSLDMHGDRIESLDADGLIFSTPTGSSAYALSAGGAVLDPLVNAYEIVPICPLSRELKPFVVPEETITKVRVLRDKNARLVIDGEMDRILTKKDRISITQSFEKAYFVKFKRDFFRKVKELE